MNKSINLLVPEQHDTALTKRIAILRLISMSVITLIVVASVSLFFLILSSPLPSLRNQENSTRNKLREYDATSGKYFVVRERLGVISSILEERIAYEDFIRRIQEFMPPGTEIEEIQAEGNLLSVTVSSTSLLPLQSFIESMNSLKQDESLFSGIKLSTLRYDEETSRYSVEVQATLVL